MTSTMKLNALIALFCLSVFGCLEEGVKRRSLTADQLAQKTISHTYPRGLKGGVYQCRFPDWSTKMGFIRVSDPELSFHFNNEIHDFGTFDGKPANTFTINNFSKSFIGAVLKIERPQNTSLEVNFNRLDGYGVIRGLQNQDIYFENCFRIK